MSEKNMKGMPAGLAYIREFLTATRQLAVRERPAAYGKRILSPVLTQFGGGGIVSAPRSQFPGGTPASASTLLTDLRELIVTARHDVARQVDSGLALLYWRIGQRIRQDILNEQRAEYGEDVIATLGRQLAGDFGAGFAKRNLAYMVQFAVSFPNEEIVHALRAQLGWTHFRLLLPIDDPLKRDFYAELCRVERWSTRVLAQKIQSMLFERTAISRKPAELIRKELAELRDHDKLTPDLVFRDPYLLDFLGLKDTYAEKDVEAAILREIEAFILELGVGFAFMERQKRITVDGDDYYLCWTWRRAASAWHPTGPNRCPGSYWSENCTRPSRWPGANWLVIRNRFWCGAVAWSARAA